MGCCGCNNKSSAITAGIFGLIQSIIGLIFNAYFLNLYTTYSYSPFSHSNDGTSIKIIDEQDFLIYSTYQVQGIILMFLAIATILHSAWLISSIILLIGNAKNNSCCVRQWVIITSFIIIGDILMPIIVPASTYGSFINVVESMTMKVQSSAGTEGNVIDRYSDWAVSTVSLNMYSYYIILLFSFTKLGLITIIINICLNVFTNRRATEISCPRGYVVGTSITVIQGQPSVPGMIQVGPGTVITQAPVIYNSSFPQTGMTNPYYAANIPLQPAVGFAPQYAPGSSYPETNEAEATCNALNEPLLPPKSNSDC